MEKGLLSIPDQVGVIFLPILQVWALQLLVPGFPLQILWGPGVTGASVKQQIRERQDL